jgi:hypothetical protein
MDVTNDILQNGKWRLLCLVTHVVEEIPTVIQRVRALHHPRLKPGNKDKLGRFAEVLIEHVSWSFGQGYVNASFPFVSLLTSATVEAAAESSAGRILSRQIQMPASTWATVTWKRRKIRRAMSLTDQMGKLEGRNE